MATETTNPLKIEIVAGRPTVYLGATYQVSGAFGQLLPLNNVTMRIGHAYKVVTGSIDTISTGSNFDSTYESGIWPAIGPQESSSGFTSDGSTTYTCLEQPVAWVQNDDTNPIAATNIGKIAYWATGQHVCSPGTASGSYVKAGVIEDFDPVSNKALINLARKTV
jgi:hypothetical protein